MNTELDKLRAVVEDEQQPLPARRSAADHLVRLGVEAVEATDVQDDDPEVVELRSPWKNVEVAQLFSKNPDARPLKGWSLPDARAEVIQRRKLRAILATVVDETAHPFERLAGCGAILKDHAVGKWRRNGYTPERLLNEVLPANGSKWTPKGKAPIQRPPQSLQDVWSF